VDIPEDLHPVGAGLAGHGLGRWSHIGLSYRLSNLHVAHGAEHRPYQGETQAKAL
jgi:hypothetical protein